MRLLVISAIGFALMGANDGASPVGSAGNWESCERTDPASRCPFSSRMCGPNDSRESRASPG